MIAKNARTRGMKIKKRKKENKERRYKIYFFLVMFLMSPVSFETSLWPLTSLSFSLALSGAIISPSAGPVARLFVGVVVRRKPQIAGKKQREREKKKMPRIRARNANLMSPSSRWRESRLRIQHEEEELTKNRGTPLSTVGDQMPNVKKERQDENKKT